MKRFMLRLLVMSLVLGGIVLKGMGFAEEQAAAPVPLKICMLSGSVEYQSDVILPILIEYMKKSYAVDCTLLVWKEDNDLPGLEALSTCDVMLLFTRRLTIEGEQLERVKDYCLSGKPIVGIRTASHAFQNWLELDKLVLGGNYQGHYGSGPVTQVTINPPAKKHPILAGVEDFSSVGSLYQNTPPAADVFILLTGTIPDHSEPVAWTRVFNGGKIFYTSLGHPDDFKNENFLRMVSNALFWVCGREPALLSGATGN
ncbi:MAG: ThuA domain-containing protein [Candidatus Omnitrophota bacterium]|jgi:type 1 glutamine amidotransferase|nr:MAG: ThuA domain-containing protein [Candidatus Omnitrophota bacterium]